MANIPKGKEPVGRLIDESVRYNTNRRSPDLHTVTYLGTNKGTPTHKVTPAASPLLPRLPPRSSTPIPTHSSTPPPGSDSGPSSRRPSALNLPDPDLRRGSMTQKALHGLRNAADSSLDAGRKVKDKTVTYSGQMKDATVGASQWVASKTSETAKAAMDQARSRLSCGEKFIMFMSEKGSLLSRRGFTHVFLFLILFGYTALGAVLFMFVEGRAEDKRELQRLSLEASRSKLIIDLWEHGIQLKPNFTRWKDIMTDLLPRYDTDLIYAHENGINPQAHEKTWTFWKSMFYCSTITTTIGYGHIAPSTVTGQALTIGYAILGIPIFLILLADFGKLFTRMLKAIFVFFRKLYRTATCRAIRTSHAVQASKAGIKRLGSAFCNFITCCKGKKEDEEKKKEEEKEEEEEEEGDVDDNFNLPISLALFILLIYMMVGCIIYPLWEDWTYFEAAYFIFISITTIGFGDYVPKHPSFMMLTTLYLIFGLALTAMSINIIQEKLSNTFQQASEKLKTSMRAMMATASQGEEGDLKEGKEVEVAEVHGEKQNLPKDKMELKKET